MAIQENRNRERVGTIISMWSQSAPNLSILSASEAKLAKSEDSIDGAIFAATPIFVCLLLA